MDQKYGNKEHYDRKGQGRKHVNHITTSEFARLHPLVTLSYALAVIVITMCTLNPYILGISIVAAVTYGCMSQGIGFMKRNLFLAIPVIIFTVLIQPLFSRSGTTALFYINDNAVTVESYIYGLMIGVLLVGMMQWSSCLRMMFTSEKMMYLFGSVIPSLGLVLSMILRYVPLLRDRYQQIQEAQYGMGRRTANIGLFGRVRIFMKELSILISWSLESSIETSTSMEARGYGLKGRSNYSRYRLKKSDILFIAVILLLAVVTIRGIVIGAVSVYYLPRIYMCKATIDTYLTIGTFAGLGMLPIVYDLISRCSDREAECEE